ncbi:MAG: Maf family protein [Hyphomicrobiaceae bacterium]
MRVQPADGEFPNHHASRNARLVLASGSASRRALMTGAGLTFDVIPSQVDEPAVRQALEAGGVAPSPETVALKLAEAKALDVSALHPDAIVIGSDQVLALGDQLFEKPIDLDGARAHLRAFRGRQHRLVCGVATALGGAICWRHVEIARLSVRAFSDDFLDWYLDTAGSAICQSVGAYQLEGLGAHLFDRIEGDYFTILGLPLMALLDELRRQGVVRA